MFLCSRRAGRGRDEGRVPCPPYLGGGREEGGGRRGGGGGGGGREG